MTPKRIAKLGFAPELQNEFARLSGDWNPLHVDNIAARRTAQGKLIVHGMHTVLRALESLATSSRLPVPSMIKARFIKPVMVDDSVSIILLGCNDKELQLQAQIDGVLMTDVHVILGDSNKSGQALDTRHIVDHITCRELSLADLTGQSGTVSPAATADTIHSHFPNAARWLGADKVSALLCLSRLVGMECPGLHSLFSGFTINCSQQAQSPVLEYRVAKVDQRFRLAKMNVTGLGIGGTVEAFAVHPPVAQIKARELSALVAPDEFAGQRCLIVGGSRGLGELTAKLLGAGGGYPIITYAIGKKDADRVAGEITQCGGQCEVLKYDVRTAAAEQLHHMSAPISHCYYYATCPINRRRTKCFDYRAMEEFLDFYVRGFYELCMGLHEMHDDGIVALYPSSVFVEDRPRDMTEYAMAKSAGELLCADLNRFCPGMRIKSVRLPRLATDQTASFIPTQNANSAEVILPIVRMVQSIRTKAVV